MASGVIFTVHDFLDEEIVDTNGHWDLVTIHRLPHPPKSRHCFIFLEKSRRSLLQVRKREGREIKFPSQLAVPKQIRTSKLKPYQSKVGPKQSVTSLPKPTLKVRQIQPAQNSSSKAKQICN